MTFGITAMILVGAGWTIFGGVMGKAPKENIKVSALLFWVCLTAFVLSVTCGIVQGFPTAGGKGLAIAILSQLAAGVANYWQLEIMSRAMQKGHNGIIWSIVQAGFIFPFFMGIVFFGVPLTWVRSLALLSVLISIALSGMSQGRGAGKWLFFAFTGFLLTGISQCLSNLPSYFPEAEGVSSIWRTGALSLGFVLGTFTCNLKSIPLFCKEIMQEVRTWKIWKYCLLLQGIEIITNYFFLYPGMDALSKVSMGAVAYPLMVSSCLLVFDLYSLLVLREKHTLVQWTSLLLCILAVIGLSVK